VRTFDVSRAAQRVRSALEPPWQARDDRRPNAIAFGAGLLLGAAIGTYLGAGPVRALLTRNGQAFVDLSTEPVPAPASDAPPRSVTVGLRDGVR
jgi:hypothetical protein